MISQYKDAWLSGFIGGEGCFTLQVHTHSGNGYDSLTASFRVKLRRDDEEILHTLKERLECGTITYREAFLQTKPAVEFQVQNISDLHNKVIPFFSDNPILNKKQTDFEIFKKGIEFIYKIHQRERIKTARLKGSSKWQKEDWDYIKSVVAELKQNRTYQLSNL